MSTEIPLVSVIIPAYNGAAFIAQTLRSVLAQTYSNLEVLVVDDGSTDETAEIVTTFGQVDPRVRLLHQANAGVAAARNLAIAQSQGEFIAPIDADDLWYPENLERQVHCMVEGGDAVGLVYSWSIDIDETATPLGSFRASEIQGNVYPTLVCHNFLGNASASMIRRSCLEEVGGYDPTLRDRKAQGCEDWDLYLRIAERWEFRVVPAFLIGYRKLSASMSCDYSQMARSHNLVMQTVQQQHPELPKAVFRLSTSNLYMYFGHQSHRCQNHRTTLFWLGQTLRADPFTPWIRPGLYRLLLQSLWGILRSPQTSGPQPTPTNQPAKQITLVEIEQRRSAIGLMLLVGNLFHRVISFLAHGTQPPCPSSCSPSQRELA